MLMICCFLQEFAKDIANFRETMSEFDRRLGNILIYSFLECSNCEAALKVVFA